MTTDLELIDLIKNKQDSKALVELASRHTGVYASIVNQYASYSPAVKREDLLDERLTNIWEYAKQYDPLRGMKFSTFVGEQIKFECKTLLSKGYVDKVDVNEQLPDGHNFITTEEARDDLKELLKGAEAEGDVEFSLILSMRSQTPPATWVEIGRQIGTSHEWARKVYYKRLKELKKDVLS